MLVLLRGVDEDGILCFFGPHFQTQQRRRRPVHIGVFEAVMSSKNREPSKAQVDLFLSC